MFELRNTERESLLPSTDTMEEKLRQFEHLTRFSQILNSTLDPDLVREKALEATCALLGCETASLLLVDFKTGELYWETALGEKGKELKRSVRLPINDRSIAGYVTMTGESLLLNDVEADPRHYKQEKGFRTRTMICIPLKAKNRVIGVLQALNKSGTSPSRGSQHPWADFDVDDLRL